MEFVSALEPVAIPMRSARPHESRSLLGDRARPLWTTLRSNVSIPVERGRSGDSTPHIPCGTHSRMRRIRKGRVELRCWYLGAVVAWLLSAGPALAAPVTGHAAPDMLPVLAALALILVSARLGGALFERFQLPTVLGELAAGVL